MHFTKRILEEQDHCYAVEVMQVQGEPYVFYAAENRGGCFAWDCETLSKRLSVWEQPGGTMSIVEIPGKPGEFLAVQKFFRLYDWEEACLVWVKPRSDGNFDVRELFTLPYLHRFDLLKRDGRVWLLACTLAEHKQTREDWSCPGNVYGALLPDDWNQPIELTRLRSNFYQNHGYCRIPREKFNQGLVTCQQGVFLVTPPAGNDDPVTWDIRQLMTQPTSDAALIDLDGDGQEEIATIEAFHGNHFRIYHRSGDEWTQIYEHPETTEFYHVVKSGTLCGKKVFIGGCRRGKQQLFAVSWNPETQSPEMTVVDEGVGPSNALIYNGRNGDWIFSANREKAQAAAYLVEE